MTSNQLAIIEAVRGVTASASSMVNTYQLVKSVRKQQSAELSQLIKNAQKACYAHCAAELLRINLAELAKVQRDIEFYEFNPAFLGFAMQQASVLNKLLLANLADYEQSMR